ncbi:MAG: Ig-like domain-containing protein [Pseudomonadota bacterium]
MTNNRRFLLHLRLYSTLCVAGMLTIGGLSGCGGGGDAGSEQASEQGDTTSPQVSSIAPADGDTGVETDTSVSVRFDEDIFATTVDDTSFTLRDVTGSVSGAVTFDGATNDADFTPDAPLALVRRYTARLSGDITDLSGNELEETEWSFTSRDGSWQDSETAYATEFTNHNYKAVFDGNGDGLAIWSQTYSVDGLLRNRLMSNRYTNGQGWGEASNFGGEGNTSSVEADIALDSSGNAIAVFEQYNAEASPTRDDIVARYFNAESGWGTVEGLEAWEGGSGEPKVAIDPDGNAMALWVQMDGSTRTLWSARHTAEGGWEEPVEVTSADAGYNPEPSIAFDGEGNALAVWNEHEERIMARRYLAGSGWQAIETVHDVSGSENDGWGLVLDVNSRGDAIVAWELTDTNTWIPIIEAVRYTAGSGWGAAETVAADESMEMYWPRVAIDDRGDALVNWMLYDGGRQLWTSRFEESAGWTEPEPLSDSLLSIGPVATDAAGNAMTVWSQDDDDGRNLYSSRYVSGQGWGEPILVETLDGDVSRDREVLVNPDGSARASWIHENADGSYSLHTSHLK